MAESPKKKVSPSDAEALDKRAWANWILAVSTWIASTLGLCGALYLQQQRAVWPWDKSESVLLGGLAISVLLFSLYLTRQQLQLVNMRKNLRRKEAAAKELQTRSLDQLVGLLNVNRIMGQDTDPQTVLDTIAQSCFETFPSDRVSLMLLDRESGDLVVKSAAAKGDIGEVVGARVKLGEGVAGRVGLEKSPMFIGGAADPGEYKDFAVKKDIPAASLVVPIVIRDELSGVLNVTSFDPQVNYDNDDLKALLVFAETAGICCRHSEQLAWMRDTIQRLDEELEKRENGTAKRQAA